MTRTYQGIYELDGCPVSAVEKPWDFRSVTKAARAMGVTHNAIRFAVEKGTRCCRLHWRYSDMPAACQPLRPAKERSIKCLDTKEVFPSIATITGRLNREWMKLSRAIKSGRPYLGRRYEYV